MANGQYRRRVWEYKRGGFVIEVRNYEVDVFFNLSFTAYGVEDYAPSMLAGLTLHVADSGLINDVYSTPSVHQPEVNVGSFLPRAGERDASPIR